MTVPYGRKQSRTKDPPDASERREWKSWLKLNIQKTKIMVSGPITSWQINREAMKWWQTVFWGLQNHCKWWLQHEIKRLLLLGRKAMTNLDSILKSRDITSPTMVHLGKAIVFPAVMYWCESWTIKKAERWRTDAFELWYWKRLLRVPWTARRYNQSILKEINFVVHWKDWCWSWNSNTLASSCKELTH